MPLLHLTTFIAAPAKRVFDLSRSIDLHRSSMGHHQEAAVAGRTTGLIGKGESVTWKARHLKKERFLKIQITEMDAPASFVDEMLEGDFRSMRHEHYFKPIENGTIMIDKLYFEMPYGIFGRLFNSLYLEGYMRRLLEERNAAIMRAAETDQWKTYL
jgi:ligand-binding SRPBCC domain-containing protein